MLIARGNSRRRRSVSLSSSESSRKIVNVWCLCKSIKRMMSCKCNVCVKRFFDVCKFECRKFKSVRENLRRCFSGVFTVKRR